MHRFIGTSLRSVTAEFSRSTWRSMVPDDATIGGHCLDSFVFAPEFDSSDVLRPATRISFVIAFGVPILKS